jgi:hypothetical protein
MSIVTLRHIMRLIICAFILFALYFYLVGYKEEVPNYMEYMRGIITIGYCTVIYMSMNRNISRQVFFTYLFVSFYLLSVILQYSMIHAAHRLFGFSSDAYTYIAYGMNYRDLGILDFWKVILSTNRIDDLGFNTIVFWCAKICGRDALSIANLLIFLNSIIYIIGVYYFYQLCVTLLDDKHRARIATGLWAGFSTLIITNASGVKEVIFTAIIVIAMYCIYKYKESPTRSNLLRALLFIGLCILFRFVICYALVLSLLTIIFTNENNKKAILIFFFSGILFSSAILSLLLPTLTGYTYEQIVKGTDIIQGRIHAISNVFTASLYPTVSTFLGPFPNINRTNMGGFMYGFALLLKNFFSPYFLSAIYSIIRNCSYRFYPILVYITGNLMLVLITRSALDIRFHITYIPFFFLLIFIPQKFIFKGYKYYIILLLIIVIISVYAARGRTTFNTAPKTEFKYLN